MQLGLPALPEDPPELDTLIEKRITADEADASGMGVKTEETPSQVAKDLHRVLLETCVMEGKLCCGNCGHEYWVKEGIANFLLPGHLV
jgi:multifunctional methyltransferase subunit TRM112